MNTAFLLALSAAAVALMLLEHFGLIGARELKLKGDIKRETRWIAQYGQGTCVIVAALLVWRLDPRRLPRSGYLLTPAIMLIVGSFGTAFLCVIVKRLLGRVRPGRERAGQFLGPTLKHDNWRESFPSMHTASAFAFTVLMARLYPAAAIVFWILAVVCAALRYLLNAHWPSDVVGGCAIGYGLGSWAWVYWGGQAT